MEVSDILPEPFHSDPAMKPQFASNPAPDQWLSAPFWLPETGRRWGTGSWVRWKYSYLDKTRGSCLMLWTSYSYDAHFPNIWGCNSPRTQLDCAWQFVYNAPHSSYCNVNLSKYSCECPEPLYGNWTPCEESVPKGQKFQQTRTLINKEQVDYAAANCYGCLKADERQYRDTEGIYELVMSAVIDQGVAGSSTAEGTLTYNLPGCPNEIKQIRFKTGKKAGGGIEDGVYDVPLNIVYGGNAGFGNINGRSDKEARWRTNGQFVWSSRGGNGDQYPDSPSQVRGSILIHPDGSNDGTAGCIGLNQEQALEMGVRDDFLFLNSIGVFGGQVTVVTLPGVTRKVGKTDGKNPIGIYQTTVGAYGTVLKEPVKGDAPKNNLNPYIQQLGQAYEGVPITNPLGSQEPPSYNTDSYRPPLN